MAHRFARQPLPILDLVSSGLNFQEGPSSRRLPTPEGPNKKVSDVWEMGVALKGRGASGAAALA